ncbi:BapA/Bap/LapF family prefix-like domain-containing protein, partial [Acinetobacter baumannii]|uniref:BapA/Bap/LapF family prefix-like domain-containing protein n=1 Tax=Acinetobacter baumannii TaxID=470 RepID=UPI0038B525F0
MTEIRVVSKESHETLETTTEDTVSLSEASVILIKINKDDVSEIKQDGRNVIITLKNGEQIVIVNFFNNGGSSTENSLVFEDSNHKLLWVQFTDNNGVLIENFNYIDSIEPLLYHDGAASPWAWLSVPLTAAGILWWAHDSDDKTGDTKQKDITAPDAPVIDPVNGTNPISGNSEPGSTVTVTYPDGSTATVVAGPDGSWTVPNPGLNDGDVVKVIASDPAGNNSTPATAIVDAIAPDAPVIDPINGTDPITGTAEPGSTVTVTYPDGSTATVVAGPDGSWSVPNPGLHDGDVVKVIATDPAGNNSTPATAIVDAIAPDAPVIDPINGTDPITGTTEPGSTVTVTYPDGSTATVVAGPDGTWTVPNPGLNDGDVVKVIATDPAGNPSLPSTSTVDTVGPNATGVNFAVDSVTADNVINASE